MASSFTTACAASGAFSHIHRRTVRTETLPVVEHGTTVAASPTFTAIGALIEGIAQLGRHPEYALYIVVVCMILCWRAQLELAAQLLALGSNTLLENGGLIPVKIICMIMEVIFTIPILIFIVASNVQDGDWAGSTSGGECQSVCAWSTSGSASTYYHFVSASCAHAHPPTIPLPLTRRCSLPGSLC